MLSGMVEPHRDMGQGLLGAGGNMQCWHPGQHSSVLQHGSASSRSSRASRLTSPAPGAWPGLPPMELQALGFMDLVGGRGCAVSPLSQQAVDAVWTMNWQACCRAETALTALPWGAGREVRPCRLSEATQTPLLCPADGSPVISSPGLVLGLVSGQSGPCQRLLHLQLR